MTQARDGVDPADWVTIWQSEWAAIAVDREVLEGLTASAVAWNVALAARLDGPAGRPGADAPAGAAPARPASGNGERGPAAA